MARRRSSSRRRRRRSRKRSSPKRNRRRYRGGDNGSEPYVITPDIASTSAHLTLDRHKMRIGPEVEICTRHDVRIETINGRFESVTEVTVNCLGAPKYYSSEYRLPDHDVVLYSPEKAGDALKLFREMKTTFTPPNFRPSDETVLMLSDGTPRYSSDSTHFHLSFRTSDDQMVTTTSHPFLILSLQMAYILHSPHIFEIVKGRSGVAAIPPTKYPLKKVAMDESMLNKHWEFSVRPTLSLLYPGAGDDKRLLRVECRRLGSIQALTDDDLLWFTQNMYSIAGECMETPMLGIDQLKYISLSKCHLQPDAGQNIARVLDSTTCALTYLDVSHNNLKRGGVDALVKCQKEIQLNVSYNNVDEQYLSTLVLYSRIHHDPAIPFSSMQEIPTDSPPLSPLLASLTHGTHILPEEIDFMQESPATLG